MEYCPSYFDLYRAVYRRDLTKEEIDEFEKLDQANKNQLVKNLVRKTRGAFECQDRKGTDGKIYTAFWTIRHPKEESQAYAAILPYIVNGQIPCKNFVKKIDSAGQTLVILEFEDEYSVHIHLVPKENKIIRGNLRNNRSKSEFHYQLTDQEMAMILYFHVQKR